MFTKIKQSETLGLKDLFVVYPGSTSFVMDGNIDALAIRDIESQLLKTNG